MSTPTKEQPSVAHYQPPAPSILSVTGLSAWNLVLLVVMIGSFLLQHQQFKTRMEGFREDTKGKIETLKGKVEELASSRHPLTLAVGELRLKVADLENSMTSHDEDISAQLNLVHKLEVQFEVMKNNIERLERRNPYEN